MYGTYPYGNYYGMYGGIYNMYSPGINSHQYLKNRYGVGHEDFGTRPHIQPYTMAIVPKDPLSPPEKNPIKRFIKECYK